MKVLCDWLQWRHSRKRVAQLYLRKRSAISLICGYVTKVSLKENFDYSCWKPFVNGRFYTTVALFVWTNLGKHMKFIWLCVTSIKTGTRRIMRLGVPSFVIRLERRTTNSSSSGRIMRLTPVFILQTHNQTNFKMFAEVCPDGQCVLSIKTANVGFLAT